MHNLLLNVMAASLYACGAAFMKASSGLRVAWAAILLYACFAAGATLQAFALQTQDIGVANTVVLGIEAMAGFLLGVVFFGEPVTGTKVAAIALVGAGVYLLRR